MLPLLTACGGLEPTVVDRFVQGRSHALVPLVDGAGAPAGLGVVVRATYDQVVLLCPPAGAAPPALQLGPERVATRRLSEGLVTIPRRWDLRSILPAGPLEPGSEVLLLSAKVGAWIDGWVAQVQSQPGEPLRLGAPVPTASRGDLPAPETSPEALRGALVFSLTGELAGVVREVDEEQQLLITPVRELTRALLACLPPGEEVLAPEEAALLVRLDLGPVRDLPAATDSWGQPDFLLLLQVAGVPLEPLPLGSSARERGPWLVRVPALGPVQARLAERDVTLAEGVVDHPVGLPVERPALGRGLELSFLPDPEFLRAQPQAWTPGSKVQARLDAEVLDPDAASGPDRIPLGGAPATLRRVVGGTVDLFGADGTDFLLLDVPVAEELSCVFLRRDPRATISVQARSGAGLDTVLRVDPGHDRRLSITRGPFQAGRSLVRVQMLAGPPGPSPWEVLFVPSADPFGLVRTLFRLLAREAESEAAWLDTREFAQELAAALSFEAGMDPNTAASAILAELGHRNAVVRHLALRLLEVHFPPDEQALEALRGEGLTTPRGLDAGLLLALRRGATGPRDAEVLRLAAVDPDPLIRLRALVGASRLADPVLRAALRELFRNDPSPLVRRALERSEQ